MKRVVIAALAAVGVLAIVLGGVHILARTQAVAQEGSATKTEPAPKYTCPMHPAVKASWATKCPKCGMDLVSAEEKAVAFAGCPCPWCTMAHASKAADKDEAAKATGMSPAMMMCCRMMMRAAIDPQDPAALLALKDDLGLTDEQTDKLQAIVQETRQQAAAVLTPAQKEKLKGLADAPGTMMDMCRRMMGGHGAAGHHPGMHTSTDDEAPAKPRRGGGPG